MNLSQRKALDEKVRNGYKVTMQDALDMFFLPEDQDAFAQSLGYEDADQMVYYENMSEEGAMTDREADELVEREEAIAQQGAVEYLAPPPSEILVLAPQDAREVYQEPLTDWQDMQRANEEDEACPLALWYDTSAELEGVY